MSDRPELAPAAFHTGGHPRLLAGLAMAQLLVALDFSIVYVALPTIGDALSFSAVGLQWIVSAYGVFFAGFLL